MDLLLGTDKVSPTGKNKINEIVIKLRQGYLGQVPVSNGNGADFTWRDIVPSIPGGATDDILIKSSDLPNNYQWGKGPLPKVISINDETSRTVTTSYTTASVSAPSDGRVRNNLVTICGMLYADNTETIAISLLRNGVQVKGVNMYILASPVDDSSLYQQPFSFTYLDANAPSGSAYTVLWGKFSAGTYLLKTNSLTVQSYIL